MENKVLYIKPSKSGATYLLGILTEEGEERFKIPSTLYRAIGSPQRGGILTDEELSDVRAADEEQRATKKALSLLSYADSSERALALKLRRAGYSNSAATEAARDMVMHGYIDEHRQLLRLVEREANVSLAGPLKLLPKLVGKGYTADGVRSALRELISDGTVDLSENARRLIEKKLGENPSDEERKKLLYKYGYKI